MQVEEMNQAHLEEAITTIWTVQHVITTTNKRSSAKNAHKKRILAIKGQLTSSWGFFSRAIKITFHFNSEAHAEAQAEIRNKRRAGEIKRKTEGDGERQERGGTRDKQTERGMWRQSHRVEEIPVRDRDRARAREGDMWIWLQADDVMYVCQVISRRADSVECTGQDRASSVTAAARRFVWCAAEITHSVERLSVCLVLPLIRSSAQTHCCRAKVCKCLQIRRAFTPAGRKSYRAPWYLSFPSGLDNNDLSESRRVSGTSQFTHKLYRNTWMRPSDSWTFHHVCCETVQVTEIKNIPYHVFTDPTSSFALVSACPGWVISQVLCQMSRWISRNVAKEKLT